MYLFIDTSTHFGAVGVWSPPDGRFLRLLAWSSRHNHTAELMPAVETVLETAGLVPASLTGLGVACGPGGFSALRAGLGAAKGLAFALGIPIAGASTLEASAYAHRDAGWPVCAVIPAGRALVSWARFEQTTGSWRRRTPDRVTPVEELLARTGRHTLFCGEGAAIHAEALREAMGPRAHFLADGFPVERLKGLAELVAPRLDAGEGDLLAALQPLYLRPPGITKPKTPKAVRYGAAAGTGR